MKVKHLRRWALWTVGIQAIALAVVGILEPAGFETCDTASGSTGHWIQKGLAVVAILAGAVLVVRLIPTPFLRTCAALLLTWIAGFWWMLFTSGAVC